MALGIEMPAAKPYERFGKPHLSGVTRGAYGPDGG